ncbi:MAG: hypothetical protein Q7S96_03545 [bacterium]|nr:hypothetical protein [bacterium]
MENLKHFLAFHHGSLRQRAVKVSGSILAATFLLIGATAIEAHGAVDSAAEELHIFGSVCAPVETHRGLDITWQTTTATEENHVMYGRDPSFGSVAQATAGTEHTARIEHLTSGATIHYRVYARRVSTGETVQSGTCTVTLDGTDRAAPRFTGLHAGAPTANTMEITVATNEPTELLISLTSPSPTGATPVPEATITRPATAQTTHHIALTGLLPEVDYVVRIDAMDHAGNSVTLTPDVTFRTLHETVL